MEHALEAALAGLPHGPEFRFVDRLEALEPGVSATGHYTLRGDEPFLAGHFPDQPMMPGVLMVEAIAQLAGIAASQSPGAGVPLRLAAIRNARIHAAVSPGTMLRLEARISARMGKLIHAEGCVRVGDQGLPVATAQVTLSCA